MSFIPRLPSWHCLCPPTFSINWPHVCLFLSRRLLLYPLSFFSFLSLSFPIMPSILNAFALFLLPSNDLSFSVPCPDIRLLTVVAISVVYPFVEFLTSFVSSSPLILHYCFVLLNSQLSPNGFLLHLEIHSRWGSKFSAFLAALELGFQTVLAHFLYYPLLLLQFLFLPLSLCFLALCYSSQCQRGCSGTCFFFFPISIYTF